ncbi:MAG: hypothetical protein ACXU8A_03890 [Burkholderiaceae bacterium]
MFKRANLTIASAINTGLIALMILATVAQFVIEFSTDNIASVCIVLISSSITLLYFRWTDSFVTHPLSSFAIFGLCITTQLGALLAQSFFWAPLIYELRQSLATFSTLAFYQLIAIAAHAIYRFFPAMQCASTSPIRRVLQKSGLYATPTVMQLWIIGLVGIFAIHSPWAAANADIGTRLSSGFIFLAWAPFLIPTYVQQQGRNYCKVTLNYCLLLGYFLLLGFISIAANARGMMFAGAITIALIFLLAGLRNAGSVTNRQIIAICSFMVVSTALLTPLSDLATAMAIARNVRTRVSALQMVDTTFNILQKQPHLIESFRLKSKMESSFSAYDENYISNPIVARFVETKFHDNALYFASRLSPRVEDEMITTTTDFLWATLPTPVLNFLDVKIEKENLRFSFGDYLVYLTNGLKLGGYRTGSAFAHGIALFGPFFPMVYLAICLVMFPILDLMTFRSAPEKILITALGLLQIWTVFLYGITAESLHHIFLFIVRTFIQTILIYLFAFHLARLIEKLWPDSAEISKGSRPLAK